MHETVKDGVGDRRIDYVQHDDEQVAIATAPVLLYERILRHHCLAWEDRGYWIPLEQLGALPAPAHARRLWV